MDSVSVAPSGDDSFAGVGREGTAIMTGSRTAGVTWVGIGAAAGDTVDTGAASAGRTDRPENAVTNAGPMTEVRGGDGR